MWRFTVQRQHTTSPKSGSCMCCQESGEREANVALYCPKAAYDEPKVRKLVTRAPAECMCCQESGEREANV